MFSLPPLPYEYGALEPHIDAKTMKIHHTKHHQAYIDKLNGAIKGTEAESLTLEEILAKISEYDAVVRNNAGGTYNHKIFWEIMSPNGGGNPKGTLAEHIKAEFGSFVKFRQQFAESALGRFGSGWAWLIVDKEGGLQITSTVNQDNPLMDTADISGTPILGLDVWEHAYYLHYQNRRPDYLEAWWNIVNWPEVERRYAELTN